MSVLDMNAVYKPAWLIVTPSTLMSVLDMNAVYKPAWLIVTPSTLMSVLDMNAVYKPAGLIVTPSTLMSVLDMNAVSIQFYVSVRTTAYKCAKNIAPSRSQVLTQCFLRYKLHGKNAMGHNGQVEYQW